MTKWLCRQLVFWWVATNTWNRLPHTRRANSTPMSWHWRGVTSPGRKLW